MEPTSNVRGGGGDEDVGVADVVVGSDAFDVFEGADDAAWVGVVVSAGGAVQPEANRITRAHAQATRATMPPVTRLEVMKLTSAEADGLRERACEGPGFLARPLPGHPV